MKFLFHFYVIVGLVPYAAASTVEIIFGTIADHLYDLLGYLEEKANSQ